MKDLKNILLKRREIEFVIESDKNPGFEGAVQALVERHKVDRDNVVIKSVRNKFGRRDFLVEAFVYNSKEDKDRTERKPKIKKGAKDGSS